jgi:glycosyltransferase involved in cell wall biosynthesis
MRVGLVLYGDLDGQSGGFRYDRRLIEELRAAGDTVEVVDLPWRSYPRGLLDNLSPSVRRRLEGNFDVVLQDELAHPSLLRANRRLSTPIVSVVHHLRADEGGRLAPLYRAVERRYLDTVDAAICNSEATREAAAANGSLPRERTLVAPPAGDRFAPSVTDEAIADRASSDPLDVVFLGNIAPRKGLDTLVGGLARVDAPWRLTVVGRATDASYRSGVDRQVVDAGCADRVRFTGRLSDADLADVLRSGHLLAIPSRHEGFGIAYLEGMAFGLPALATTAGGAADIVTHGENGFLVDPDDTEAVATAVSSVASDRDRLARMGRAARRRFDAHPGWTETAERVRLFLAEVAGADGGPGGAGTAVDPESTASEVI